jgi:hypothetical protein
MNWFALQDVNGEWWVFPESSIAYYTSGAIDGSQPIMIFLITGACIVVNLTIIENLQKVTGSLTQLGAV